MLFEFSSRWNNHGIQRDYQEALMPSVRPKFFKALACDFFLSVMRFPADSIMGLLGS